MREGCENQPQSRCCNPALFVRKGNPFGAIDHFSKLVVWNGKVAKRARKSEDLPA